MSGFNFCIFPTLFFPLQHAGWTDGCVMAVWPFFLCFHLCCYLPANFYTYQTPHASLYLYGLSCISSSGGHPETTPSYCFSIYSLFFLGEKDSCSCWWMPDCNCQFGFYHSPSFCIYILTDPHIFPGFNAILNTHLTRDRVYLAFIQMSIYHWLVGWARHEPFVLLHFAELCSQLHILSMAFPLQLKKWDAFSREHCFLKS